MIGRECPGLGDPWDLTPAVWDATLLRVYEARALESGDDDARMQVRLSRLLRQKRRMACPTA